MAKANLTLANGTVVQLEGSAEEVAALLNKVTGEPAKKAVSKKTHKKRSSQTSTVRKGPQTLIAQLSVDGFFKTKRTIGAVQEKLEEAGHIYAITALSTPLLRLTRDRVLRRIKEKDGWVYVAA